MALVRIVTRQPAEVADIAGRLRGQGHSVEVIDPGDFHVNRAADVELRVERMPRREALARALRDPGDIVPAPGVVTAEELRLAAAVAPGRGIGRVLGKWLAERRQAKRARAEVAAAERRERQQHEAEDRARRLAGEQVVAEQRRREMEIEAERRRALALEAERRRQVDEELRRQAAIESDRRRREDEERQRALAVEAAQRRQLEEEERFRQRQAALQEQRRREEAARLEAERQRTLRQEADLQHRREEEEQHRLAAANAERQWSQAESQETERQGRMLLAAQHEEAARLEAGQQQPATEIPVPPAPVAPEHALFAQRAAAARAATRAHMETLRRQIPKRAPSLPLARRHRKWLAAAVLAIAISVAMALGWGAAANQQPASPIPLSTLQSDQYTTQQLPFRNATVTMPGAAPHAAKQAPAASETGASPQAPAPAPKARQLRSPGKSDGGDVVIRHYDVSRPKPAAPASTNGGVKRYSDLDGD